MKIQVHLRPHDRGNVLVADSSKNQFRRLKSKPHKQIHAVANCCTKVSVLKKSRNILCYRRADVAPDAGLSPACTKPKFAANIVPD